MQIYTDIIINASKERIWEILTDFNAYPQWNPFMKKVVGNAEPNAKLKLTASGLFDMPLKLDAVLTECEPNAFLGWQGGHKKVFYGHHCFRLTELAEQQVKVEHYENFSGLLTKGLVGPAKKSLEAKYIALNNALKARAEQA